MAVTGIGALALRFERTLTLGGVSMASSGSLAVAAGSLGWVAAGWACSGLATAGGALGVGGEAGAAGAVPNGKYNVDVAGE